MDKKSLKVVTRVPAQGGNILSYNPVCSKQRSIKAAFEKLKSNIFPLLTELPMARAAKLRA